MSRIIEWKGPEPTAAELAHRARHRRAREIAAELRERPGEWALIFERFDMTDESYREHLAPLACYGARWTSDGRPYGSSRISSADSVGPYDIYAKYDLRFDHDGRYE